MDERFRESWFNTSHVVLGRALHPFCLYDALILSTEKSPFICEDEDRGATTFSLQDLQLAVLVCSTDHRVFLEARLCKTWLDKLRMKLFGRRSRMICKDQRSLEHQGKLFSTYLRDYNSGPQLWEGDDGEDRGLPEMKTPWLLAYVVRLIRSTTFRPEEVWTMPIGQVFWYVTVLAEQTGTKSIDIVSPEEEAAMKELGYG